MIDTVRSAIDRSRVNTCHQTRIATAPPRALRYHFTSYRSSAPRIEPSLANRAFIISSIPDLVIDANRDHRARPIVFAFCEQRCGTKRAREFLHFDFLSSVSSLGLLALGRSAPHPAYRRRIDTITINVRVRRRRERKNEAERREGEGNGGRKKEKRRRGRGGEERARGLTREEKVSDAPRRNDET